MRPLVVRTWLRSYTRIASGLAGCTLQCAVRDAARGGATFFHSNEREPVNTENVTHPIPVTLPVGEVRTIRIREREVIAVGSAPSGYTILLSPPDWLVLQKWKLTQLRVARGQVWAWGGKGTGRIAARFLTGTDCDSTKAIRYRNGNFLDIRRENIAVVPYSLIQRTRIDHRAADEPLPLVYRANGTYTPNKRFKPPAERRLRRLVLNQHREG